MKKLLDFFVRELVGKQQVVLRKEFDYLWGRTAKGYYWYKEKSGVVEVFKLVKKVGGEMGASKELIFPS